MGGGGGHMCLVWISKPTVSCIEKKPCPIHYFPIVFALSQSHLMCRLFPHSSVSCCCFKAMLLFCLPSLPPLPNTFLIFLYQRRVECPLYLKLFSLCYAINFIGITWKVISFNVSFHSHLLSVSPLTFRSIPFLLPLKVGGGGVDFSWWEGIKAS